MGKSTEVSVEIICRIGEMLNHEIRQHGVVPLNNKTIWHNCLHQMTNASWRAVLETLETLGAQHPELFRLDHFATIEEGLAALNKYERYYDRVLDLGNRHLNHKKLAWKCLMTIREIYCAAIGLDLPNKESSRVRTHFEDIFI